MMVRLISQTFRSVKPPNNTNLKPPKSEPSSTSSSSSLSDRSRSKLSWSVYLILSTNKPIKTYVGVTTNFSRRLKQHNGELREVQKHPVLEGHGFLHALFKDFRIKAKLVSLNQNGKVAQEKCLVKGKLLRWRSK